MRRRDVFAGGSQPELGLAVRGGDKIALGNGAARKPLTVTEPLRQRSGVDPAGRGEHEAAFAPLLDRVKRADLRSGKIADAGEDHVRERFNRGLDHQPLAEHVKGVDALLLEIQAGERMLELRLLRLEIFCALEDAPLQALVKYLNFLLGLLALGDIADKPVEDRLAGKIDPGDRDLDRKLTAVRSHRRQLEAPAE